MKPFTRILGIDYGTVRLGLAVTDADHRIASPLANYTRRNLEKDATYFQQIIEDEQIGRIVVGLPVHLSGREGQAAHLARDFGAWLAKATKLPVVFFDERFTTVQAESALWDAGLTHKRRKKRRDALAAQFMLQSFLDAGCPNDAEVKGLDE